MVAVTSASASAGVFSTSRVTSTYWVTTCGAQAAKAAPPTPTPATFRNVRLLIRRLIIVPSFLHLAIQPERDV
jgi:hypothetical protein